MAQILPWKIKAAGRSGGSQHVTFRFASVTSIPPRARERQNAGSGGPNVRRSRNQRESVARPTVNENYALVIATVPQAQPALVPLAKRVAECGCNITEARLSTLGEDVIIALHVVGSWDAIAKLEAGAARLERDEAMKITVTRSAPRPQQTNLMPYLVEVVAADKPGILFQIGEFFANRGIVMEQMNSSRYRAMQTGADMFQAQITIGIPAKTHIASLRDDFLEFCDAHNLDAIMDPVKF